MLFDPSYPDIDIDLFPNRNWNNFYGEVTEQMPTDMPEPLENEVIVCLFVDVDYAVRRCK